MKTILIILLTINLGFSQEYGIASHYSIRTNGGTHTASGIPLRDDSYTMAHKTLPFGTIAKITNLSNGKDVMVRVTNRGPYIRGRIVDLSQAAASKLGFLKKGITKVRVDVIKRGDGKTYFKK
jgi:rare lipoprotein A